jgi:DNA invertase Pin-like site-specific DNA recombinase
MGRPRGSKQQRERDARLTMGSGKALGYIRVSTKDQGERGHSLDGQRARLAEACEREGLQLVDVVCDVASGAKTRDGLTGVQRRLEAGEAQVLVSPKVDRIGRSLVGLYHLVEWAKAKGVDVLTADEGWQVRAGKTVDKMLPFRMAMAEVERERIADRTREGLAAARNKGVRLGAPVRIADAVCRRAARQRKQGLTLQEIADALNGEGLRTPTGREFRATSIMRMIDRVDPEANRGKALAA